jgi:hypothetical protein
MLSRPLHATTDAPERVVEGWCSVAIQGAEEVAKAAKKRRKQRHQEATIDDNGGINEQVDCPDTMHATEATSNSKCQAWLPTDHFEKLLEEACPNHTYPIKHKLWDCSLMKNFMATRSLSWSMEVNEAPIEDDVMPFPGEEAVMTIFGRQPSPEKRHMLDPSTGAPPCDHHGWGDTEM